MLDYLPDLGFYCLSSFLFRGHQNKVLCSLPVHYSSKVETKETKGFTFEQVHNLSLFLIE